MESYQNSLQQSQWNLFKKIFEEDNQKKNTFISPISIVLATAMLTEGLVGESKNQILKFMNFHPEEIVSKNLLNSLQSDKYQISNSLWLNKNMDTQIHSTYQNKLVEKYNSLIQKINSSDHSIINKYVEEKTKGTIKDPIDSLSQDFILLLVNVIYFKDDWQRQFKSTDTYQRDFTQFDHTKVMIPFMSIEEDLQYKQGKNAQYLIKPYKQNNLAMLLCLPNKTDGNILEDICLQEMLNFKDYKSELVKLIMPKFKFEYKKKLKNTFADLGMSSIFQGGGDFKNITNDPRIYISQILHQSFVKCDEQGTEASAFTGIMAKCLMMRMGPQPIYFILDRPFSFFIVDMTSSTLLFSGVHGYKTDLQIIYQKIFFKK